MRRIRRISSDVHVELTPMIDVVFLLLTFFFFTIVLMVRADILDVNLPQLRSGHSAEQTIPIAISIDSMGLISINGEPVELDGVAQRIESMRAQMDESVSSPIVLAVDTQSPAGVMISLADMLTGAGMGEFSIIGNKGDDRNDDAGVVQVDESP
ncbi:MAG: ExbD/TolR family protein [Phycisphaerales bacterium]